MRRAALALAGIGVFACQVASLAQPRSSPVSLAAIETESAWPDVNGEASSDAGRPAPDLSARGNPLWAIPLSKLSATRDRPLFSASRHPRQPAVPGASAPPPRMVAQPLAPAAPPFTLVGTIIGENSRIAILFDETLKTAIGVKQGDSDAGWLLRSVDPLSAVLDMSGRTVTLDLPEPAAAQGPAPPEPAAQPDPTPPAPPPPPRNRRRVSPGG